MDLNDFIFGTAILLILVALIGGTIINDFYFRPQAAETANQICQDKGYDFYESFSRIGLFSKTPVAIECKYVEKYKEMDIKLRQIYGKELGELNKLDELD